MTISKKILDEIASRAEAGDGLAMDYSARMQRAKEQGFDTDTVYYHGSDADINAFNTDGKGKTSGAGAFFTDSPDVAESYLSVRGGNITPVYLKKNNVLDLEAQGEDWNDIATNEIYSRSSGDMATDLLDLEYDDFTTTDELSQLAASEGYDGMSLDYVKDRGPNEHIYRAKEYIKEKYGIEPKDDWSNVSGDQFAEARDWLSNFYRKESNIVAMQKPSNIRSTNAAFDPAKKDSSNLLASLGAGTVAAGGLLASDDSEASFIGQAAKTFSKDALKLAEDMAEQGASRDEIWQATGQMGAPTFKDVDGKWKQEISDDMWDGVDLNLNSAQRLKDSGYSTQGALLQHQELYEAYPELYNIPVTIQDSGGSFKPNPLGGEIKQEVGDLNTVTGISDTQSINQHELQHAIQEREGFARGGSPSQFEGGKAIYDLRKSQRKEFEDSYGYNEDFDYNLLINEPELYDKLLKEGQKTNSVKPFYKEFAKRNLDEKDQVWFPKHMDNMDAEINDLSKSITKDPKEAYRRLAGEAEARNVQTRLDYDMDKRVQNPPWSTLDVPEDELIVRGNRDLASGVLLGGLAAKPTYNAIDDLFAGGELASNLVGSTLLSLGEESLSGLKALGTGDPYARVDLPDYPFPVSSERGQEMQQSFGNAIAPYAEDLSQFSNEWADEGAGYDPAIGALRRTLFETPIVGDALGLIGGLGDTVSSSWDDLTDYARQDRLRRGR